MNASADVRQKTRILYPCAARRLLSGKIFAKCTLGQLFSSKKRTKKANFAKKACPRVHFSKILPNSNDISARAYKIRLSCQSLMIPPGASAMGCLAWKISDSIAPAMWLFRLKYPYFGKEGPLTVHRSRCVGRSRLNH